MTTEELLARLVAVEARLAAAEARIATLERSTAVEWVSVRHADPTPTPTPPYYVSSDCEPMVSVS